MNNGSGNFPSTITYAEAVERYKCDRQSIRRQVDSGRIRAFKPGKQVLLVLDDADAWFYSTEVKPRTPRQTRRKRRW
jgi:excisionase family DNA binding protein